MALKNVLLVCYPESCDIKNVMKKLVEKGNIISYAYILHNLDLDETNNLKKSHYHVYIKFSKETTKEQVARFFNIDKSLVQSVVNVNGVIRYFLHLDDPNKFPYKRDSIISYGLDIDHMITQGTLGTIKEIDILKEVVSWINKGFSKKEILDLVLRFNYYSVYRSNYNIIRDLFTEKNRG